MKMNGKLFLVFLIGLTVLASVSATTDSLDVESVTVSSYEVVLSDSSVNFGFQAGEVIPLKVLIKGVNENATDVEIFAYTRGERDDGAEVLYRDLVKGVEQYVATLSLRLPDDLDDTEEVETLFVRIETDAGNLEQSYQISIQRESKKLDVLFVEADSKVTAGDVLGIDVVVKNVGRHELEDVIVVARIPELGVSRRAYFEDLVAVESDDCCNDEDEDSASGRLYLQIPSDVKAGIYSLEIVSYNEDAEAKVTKDLIVEASEDKSEVLTPATSKEIVVGEETSFDLIIVNPGQRIKVYEILPESTGLVVSVSEPLVTVPADSSKTVRVTVKANEEGTYTFGVNVNSDGELVKKATFSASAVKGAVSLGGSVTVLTIVLAVIFIVLLIVLIVLLTRRPEKSEELGESYY